MCPLEEWRRVPPCRRVIHPGSETGMIKQKALYCCCFFLTRKGTYICPTKQIAHDPCTANMSDTGQVRGGVEGGRLLEITSPFCRCPSWPGTRVPSLASFFSRATRSSLSVFDEIEAVWSLSLCVISSPASKQQQQQCRPCLYGGLTL